MCTRVCMCVCVCVIGFINTYDSQSYDTNGSPRKHNLPTQQKEMATNVCVCVFPPSFSYPCQMSWCLPTPQLAAAAPACLYTYVIHGDLKGEYLVCGGGLQPLATTVPRYLALSSLIPNQV